MNENIVVFSCPSVNNGMLSVYRESDMKLYTEIVGSNDQASIASQVSIISLDNVHKIFYNSHDSSGNGQISLLEIFIHPNISDSWSSFNTKTVITSSDYTDYGKYFVIDKDNRLIIGNQNNTKNERNSVDVVQICTHNQYYSSSSDT